MLVFRARLFSNAMARPPLLPDLAQARRGCPSAGAARRRLPPGRLRQCVTRMDEARCPDTRARRMRRAVEMPSGGG